MEPPKFTNKSRSSPTERNYQSKPIITTRLCSGVRNKERLSRRKTEEETAKSEQDNKKPVVPVDVAVVIVVVAAEEMKKVEEKATIENEKKLVVENIPTFLSSFPEEKKEERPPRSKVTSSPSSSSDKLKTKTTSSSSDNKLKKSSFSSEDKTERKLKNTTTTPASPRQRRASAWELHEKAKQDRPARRHIATTMTMTTRPIVAVIKNLEKAKKDNASQLLPAFQSIYPKASFKSAYKNTTVAAAAAAAAAATTTTQSHPGSLRNTRRRRTATTGAGTGPNAERTRRSNVRTTRRNSVLDSLSTFTDDAALSNATTITNHGAPTIEVGKNGKQWIVVELGDAPSAFRHLIKVRKH
jgi:hypothetical protein